jgi:hypothetical protein
MLPEWAVLAIAGGFSLLIVAIILLVKLNVIKIDSE